MSLSRNTRFPIYVTNMTAEGCFMKISGVHDGQAFKLIEKLLSRHSTDLRCANYVREDEIDQNKIYIADHENNFFRVKVIGVSDLLNRKVSVRFLDTGKIDTIILTSLRHLRHEGVTYDIRLRVLKPLANDYYLSRFINPSGRWNTVDLYRLESALLNTVFTAVIEMQTPILPIVSLYFNTIDVTTNVVFMQYGIGVTLASQLYNILLRAYHNEEFAEKPFIFDEIDDHNFTALSPLQSHPSSQTFGPPRNRILEVNSEHKVWVCYIDECPKKIWVQLVDDEVQMLKMMTNINTSRHCSPDRPPMIGSLCLARISQCENLICRVIIMNIFTTECELYAIDYGFTEKVSYRHIFTISEHHAHYDAFALRFTLDGAMRFNGIDVNIMFQKLVRYNVLNLKVVPAENSLIQCAKLYREGEDVLELLTKKLENQSYSSLFLRQHCQYQAVISHINSCMDFYIHLCVNSDTLVIIAEAVEEHCRNSPLLNKITMGMACCAKSSDGKWYRAQVLTIEDDKVDVRFVDFGRDEIVKTSDLRYISSALMSYDMLAKFCTLDGHKHKHKQDKETCAKNLKDVVSNKKIIATVIDETWGLSKITLHDYNIQNNLTIDINKILIDMCDLNIDNTLNTSIDTLVIDDCDYDKLVEDAIENERLEEAACALSEPRTGIAMADSVIETHRSLPNPVPLNTRYKQPDLDKAPEYKFTVTWVINPHDFYVQISSLLPEYQDMMRNVPELYENVKPIETWIPMSASVLVRVPDQLAFRAKVESNWDGSEYGVRCVDFGNKMMVKKEYMWQLDKRLTMLPRIAIWCKLSGVEPAGSHWPTSREIDACFQASNYICVFNKRGSKCKVSLYHKGVSVADDLIGKGLAIVSQAQEKTSEEDEPVACYY